MGNIRSPARRSHCVGSTRVLPPGDYAIDKDEELIDGISRLAYRRVATFIHLPSMASNSGTSQPIAINHAELETALRQDRPKGVREHDGSG